MQTKALKFFKGVTHSFIENDFSESTRSRIG